MKHGYKQPTSPNWLNELPEWSLLTKKDLVKIFNYENISSLATGISRGTFPKEDKKICQNGREKSFWKISTIKKEIAFRKELNEKKLVDLKNKQLIINKRIMEIENV
jgi:hypothetical protein